MARCGSFPELLSLQRFVTTLNSEIDKKIAVDLVAACVTGLAGERSIRVLSERTFDGSDDKPVCSDHPPSVVERVITRNDRGMT